MVYGHTKGLHVDICMEIIWIVIGYPPSGCINLAISIDFIIKTN